MKTYPIGPKKAQDLEQSIVYLAPPLAPGSPIRNGAEEDRWQGAGTKARSESGCAPGSVRAFRTKSRT
ncbi:MAG: hypothetical protein CM1200mP14_28290 [Gammaproteobacteria bacterium]|nr:MAG: hypothetical protein CM1200mP14_28290 [Gammaproteobacteria bacterium]